MQNYGRVAKTLDINTVEIWFDYIGKLADMTTTWESGRRKL